MAPLTWREVSAPNFSGVAEAQRMAGQALNGGFDSLISAISGFGAAKKDRNSQAVIADALRHTDSGSLNEALRSGSLLDGRGAVSAEALDFLANRDGTLLNNRGKVLSNEGTGIANAGKVIANKASQFNLTTAQRDDAQAQARLAAQPALAKLVTDARMLASSGDPAQVAQARQMIADNTDLLVSAGVPAGSIPGLLEGERSAGNAGFDYNQGVRSQGKTLEGQTLADQAQELGRAAIQENATPEAAVKNIQNNFDLDPRVKAQAIQMIEEAAGSKVFAQTDGVENLLAGISAGSAIGVPAPLGTGPAPSVARAATAAADNPAAALTASVAAPAVAENSTPQSTSVPGSEIATALGAAEDNGVSSETGNDDAAQLAQTASAASSQQEASSASQGTPVNPVEAAQTALYQNRVDQIFNGNGSLIDQVSNPQYANETAAQTTKRLIGENGIMPGGNQQEVLQAINETIKLAGGNLAPHIAGAIVAKNAESRDLEGSWLGWIPGYGRPFFDGDRFSSSGENQSSAMRTNMEGVQEDLRQLGVNVDGSIDIAKGEGQIKNLVASKVSVERISAIEAMLLSRSTEAANVKAAINRGQDTPSNRAALAKAQSDIQQLQSVLNQLAKDPGGTTIFSNAARGLPTR